MPYDIPVEAFAVEVAGGAHPSIRSLGSRRLVYLEHRQTVRRAYRRRQLALAVGMAGAFVAVAAVALAPGGADASPPTDVRADRPAVKAAVSRPALAVLGAALTKASARSVGRVGPSPSPRHRSGADLPPPSPPAGGPWAAARFRVPFDRDEARFPPPYVPGWHGQPLARDPFLVCTRHYESRYAGGYGAVSRGGQYRGAYQFDQVTWNGTARYMHRFDLVGADPAATAPVVQDLLAFSLHEWKGAAPWANRCAGLP